MFPRGARFFARCGGGAAVTLLLLFSDDEEACRLAKDDVVDEENDERRFWVCVDDISDKNPLPDSSPRTSYEESRKPAFLERERERERGEKEDLVSRLNS